LIQGNLVGTAVGGSSPLPNNQAGLGISDAPANLIGGTTAGTRNVISGNGNAGVYVIGGGAAGNQLQGNTIGADVTGTMAVGNSLWGLYFSNAPANLIGGTSAGAGNLISGNNDGVFLIGSGTRGNQLQGNTIGANITGTTGLGNTRLGLYLESALTNTIGGTLTGARNLISANGEWGMLLTNSSWNAVQGNYIGTAIDGATALGNGNTFGGFHAVELQAGSHDNTIGGTQTGAGNRIAFAPNRNAIDYAGIRIRDGSTNNLISGNSVFSNGGLGIDLSNYGVTTNNNCNTVMGANMLQNFPLLTQAVTGNGIGVRGTLNSKANNAFRLQFFANPACDSLGYGEGPIFLGEKVVTTDGSCNASFVAKLAGSTPAGYVITSTAIDAANNTSEFSPCVPVVAAPALSTSVAPNHQVNIAWSNNVSGFVLKQTSSLSPPIQWTTVTNNSVVVNNQFVVTISTTTGNRFYVLSFE
jgi:hypothetical protein